MGRPGFEPGYRAPKARSIATNPSSQYVFRTIRCCLTVTVEEGFEPPKREALLVFKTSAIGHSATPPIRSHIWDTCPEARAAVRTQGISVTSRVHEPPMLLWHIVVVVEYPRPSQKINVVDLALRIDTVDVGNVIGRGGDLLVFLRVDYVIVFVDIDLGIVVAAAAVPVPFGMPPF